MLGIFPNPSSAYKKCISSPKTDIISEKKARKKSNGPKKQMGVAILISNKIDFKLKSVKRDKEGHFILGKLHQEEISTLNIYAPNTRAPSYVKEKLLQLKPQITRQ